VSGTGTGTGTASVTLETLLAEWGGAAKLDVQTVLERIIGRATAPACAAFAASGKSIVTVVDADASTERVRAVYGLKADVRVAGNDDVELPKSDLVLVHGGAPHDWQSTLTALSKHATKAMIVVVANPRAWPAQARSFLARMKEMTNPGNGGGAPNGASAATTNGASGQAERSWGDTAELAPVLWEIGRVREHAFLDVPPLGIRSPKLAPRLAPRHAFVIDVTPRTPQARRRLRLGV
jgi:hypothetical protein